jgi:hypothetical protein
MLPTRGVTVRQACRSIVEPALALRRRNGTPSGRRRARGTIDDRCRYAVRRCRITPHQRAAMAAVDKVRRPLICPIEDDGPATWSPGNPAGLGLHRDRESSRRARGRSFPAHA